MAPGLGGQSVPPPLVRCQQQVGESLALIHKGKKLSTDLEDSRKQAEAKAAGIVQEVEEQTALVKSMSSETTFKDHLKNRQRTLDIKFEKLGKEKAENKITSVDMRAKAIPLVEKRIANANELVPLKAKAEDAVDAVKESTDRGKEASKEA